MSKTVLYQLDCKHCCAGVIVKDGIIAVAAPIFGKFIKQKPSDLGGWLRKNKLYIKCHKVDEW
jgi:hypothetical protein